MFIRNDQAAPELAAVEVHGMTRESFILRGALAAVSVYGLGAVSPFVRKAVAQQGGDVGILNFALTLELLEATFYERAVKEVRGLRGDVRDVAVTVGDAENEHVGALMSTIREAGGQPAKPPKFDFGNAFSSEAAFLRLAQTFEDTGVGAYNGAAPALRSQEILAAAGAIAQVEGRHAAVIRELNDNPITDGAFDKALEMDTVLTAVRPFIRS